MVQEEDIDTEKGEHTEASSKMKTTSEACNGVEEEDKVEFLLTGCLRQIVVSSILKTWGTHALVARCATHFLPDTNIPSGHIHCT